MAVNPMMDGARGAAAARSAGINGINAGVNGLAHAAQEIADLNAGERAPAVPVPGRGSAEDVLVDLRLYQRQVEASAVVVETADAVVGFLLDVRA